MPPRRRDKIPPSAASVIAALALPPHRPSIDSDEQAKPFFERAISVSKDPLWWRDLGDRQHAIIAAVGSVNADQAQPLYDSIVATCVATLLWHSEREMGLMNPSREHRARMKNFIDAVDRLLSASDDLSPMARLYIRAWFDPPRFVFDGTRFRGPKPRLSAESIFTVLERLEVARAFSLQIPVGERGRGNQLMYDEHLQAAGRFLVTKVISLTEAQASWSNRPRGLAYILGVVLDTVDFAFDYEVRSIEPDLPRRLRTSATSARSSYAFNSIKKLVLTAAKKAVPDARSAASSRQASREFTKGRFFRDLRKLTQDL